MNRTQFPDSEFYPEGMHAVIEMLNKKNLLFESKKGRMFSVLELEKGHL